MPQPSMPGSTASSRAASSLPSELKPAHVDAAIDFVLAVNVPPHASALAPASEACFSLAEHIATVERRVARLATLDPDAPHVAEAQRLRFDAAAAGVGCGQAASCYRCTRRRACRWTEPIGAGRSLPVAVGFRLPQRAGRRDGPRLTFLDFEYAGRDDPAKLVSDFFCQPEVPVPLAFMRHFIDRMARGSGARRSRTRRAAACCSTPTGSSGPASSSTISCRSALRDAPLPTPAPGPPAARAQLAKAEAKLAGLSAVTVTIDMTIHTWRDFYGLSRVRQPRPQIDQARLSRARHPARQGRRRRDGDQVRLRLLGRQPRDRLWRLQI